MWYSLPLLLPLSIAAFNGNGNGISHCCCHLWQVADVTISQTGDLNVSCVSWICILVKHDELTIDMGVLQVQVTMDVPTLTTAAILSCFCWCDWLLHVGMEDIIVMVDLPWSTMVMKAFFGDRNPSVFFGFLENTSLAVRRRFPIPSDGIQVYFSAFWKTPV
jgi:hypothetical protein